MTKYFLLDCETGGMPEKNASLLTMEGTLLNSNLEALDSISLKVKPGDGVFRIEPRAMEVNKINLSLHEKEAISESEAAEVLINFITRNNMGLSKIIPVGHNVAFDVSFMKKLVGTRNWKKMFSKKVIDTASIAEFLCLTGLLPSSEEVDCSLGGLATRFGHSYEGAHDARFDADLTLKILKNLIAITSERNK